MRAGALSDVQAEEAIGLIYYVSPDTCFRIEAVSTFHLLERSLMDIVKCFDR
jgi:hypothetical protein